MNSSDNSSSVDPWYESIAVYASDYEPATFSAGSSVEANHDLLAGLRENDFDASDTKYTVGLVTLVMVFLVAGLLSCCLLPCLYKLLGASRQERLRERMDFGRRMPHFRGNLIMVLASLAAIATASGAVWGLQKSDSGLTNIERSTQDVANDLLKVLELPTDTSTALDEVQAAYDVLDSSIDQCENGYLLSPVFDQFDLNSLTDGVQSEIDNLNEESLGELASDVQGVSDAVNDTEGVRKGVVWPTLILALLFTAIFVAIGAGTYECVAFGHSTCDAASCFISPCTVLVAVVIWLCAASAVALSALTGDFCIDPDGNANSLIGDNADGDGQLAQLITYYTTDCSTENQAVDAIISAQEIAVPVLQSTLPQIYALVDLCVELLEPVQDLDASLEGLWTVLEDAGELSSCENINGLYQAAVYDELCDDVPSGLLGFWVSCAMLTVLLLILVVQWNRMLRQQTTEKDATTVESMNNERRSRLTASRRFISNRNFFSARSSRKLREESVSASPPPAWGVGARSVGRATPTAGGATPTVQRPVVVDEPKPSIYR